MIQRTDNPRLKVAREDARTTQERRLRGCVIRLLTLPDFRFYATHLVYGRFGLNKEARGDVQNERRNAGALILAELARLDPAGFVKLAEEHARAMAEELEIELPTPQEEQDNG